MKENKSVLNKQKGFTLVELMLVVLIIGILSGVMLGVINIPGIQAKSRDARRVGDIKKIQTALELYFSDYRGYPLSASWGSVSTVLSSLSPSYINKIPTDPRKGGTAPTGVTCHGTGAYDYYYITNGTSGLAGKYVLGAVTEVSGSVTDNLCSDLVNCTSGAITCSCGGAYCYGVENPL